MGRVGGPIRGAYTGAINMMGNAAMLAPRTLTMGGRALHHRGAPKAFTVAPAQAFSNVAGMTVGLGKQVVKLPFTVSNATLKALSLPPKRRIKRPAKPKRRTKK
jgi:hypothetical protein